MSRNQDKIKAALKSIDDSLQIINTNEDWLNYLKFQSLFTHRAADRLLM